MDTGAYDVPDSSDWLNTPLSGFASLENLLHCQICKEFYDTPMLTSCAHTFCSKCIRTTLSADGKCPVCTLPDQASKLRNNWAVQEIVSSFQAARSGALDMARLLRDATNNVNRTSEKRKREPGGEDEAQREDEGGGRRTTRSKARRIAASQSSQQDVIELDDSDADSTFQPEVARVVDDGLVECVLGCGKRMKPEAMDPHMDRCEDEKKEKKAQPTPQVRQATHSSFHANNSSHRGQPQTRSQDRINELHYSGMKDGQFSKKLKDLGIPAWGTKQLMISRHKEWVNIWNANCDSASPRTQRELLKDLDTWERTQGGRAPMPNGLSTNVMRKDFDGAAYSRNHQDEFSKLIEEARRKRQGTVAKEEKPVDGSRQTNGYNAGGDAQETKGMSLDGANDHVRIHAEQDPCAQFSSAQPAPQNPMPLTNGAHSQSNSIINSNITISYPDIRTGDETRIPPSSNPIGTGTYSNGDIQKSQEIVTARTREPLFADGGGSNGHLSHT
jgi:E3 ubiquitin-protein ligase RAD18